MLLATLVAASIESLLSNAKKSDFIKTCIADEGIEVDYVILGKALKVYRGIKSRIRAEETTLKYLEEQESTGEGETTNISQFVALNKLVILTRHFAPRCSSGRLRQHRNEL